VFSKESAVAVLPVIVLYQLVLRRHHLRERAFWLACGATLVPICVMLYVRASVLNSSPAAEFPFTDNPIGYAGWLTGRLTAIEVTARYLWLTIWPAKLSCDYSYSQIPLASGTAGDWLMCGIVLAVAGAVVLLYRWNRTCFFLACFAFLNFVPASNLVVPIGTIMADRLFYVPCLGVIGCLVVAIDQIPSSTKVTTWARATLWLVIAVFALRTWFRNRDWRNDLTLATTDVRVSPRSFKLHRLLATSMFESDPSHSNIDQVIAEQEKSMAIIDSLPANLSPPDVYRTAGYYFLVKSRQEATGHDRVLYHRAIEALLRCISIDDAGRSRYRASSEVRPLIEGDGQAHLLLSVAYLESGAPSKALQPAISARMLDPLNAQVYRQLTAVFLAQQNETAARLAAAMEDCIESLQKSEWKPAADVSSDILRLDASEYPVAYYLSALANLRLGNFNAAERSAREALGVDNPELKVRAGYVLGLVLAKKGQFSSAAKLLRKYVSTFPNAPDAEVVRNQLQAIEASARAASVN
jgi:tetratricopeptide (TPR) repeat protein